MHQPLSKAHSVNDATKAKSSGITKPKRLSSPNVTVSASAILPALKREDFEALYHLPVHEACLKLHISRQDFTLHCRRVGIQRYSSMRY